MLRFKLGASDPASDVTLSGVKLTYNDEGYGPAIVCLHAIGHGASDYQSLRERFRDRFRVIALDWPGHGKSEPDSEPVSIARYTELLRLFLLQAKVDKAVLIGNSIGGAAALRYTVEQPHKVRGLVLMNPAGLDPRDWVSSLGISAMEHMFEAGVDGASWFDFAFQQYYKLVLPQAPEQRMNIVAAGRELAPLLLQAWRSFADPASDLRALAPRVECPVLFAWAKRDRFVQLRRHLGAISLFPKQTLRTFAAGHCPQLETPAEFENAVEQFLAKLDAAESAA